MKWIHYIGHPLTLIIVFPCLLISGDKLAVPYALSLWFALPTGAPYAIMAITGLIVLYIGYQVNMDRVPAAKLKLYIVGLTLLLWSLVDFWGHGDYSATFEDTLPLLSFILFFICVLCFVWNTAVIAARLLSNRTKPA